MFLVSILGRGARLLLLTLLPLLVLLLLYVVILSDLMLSSLRVSLFHYYRPQYTVERFVNAF